MEPAKGAQPRYAYVGCFTTAKRKARGKGVAVFRIDESGKWTFVHACDAVPNPHYVAFDRTGRFLYSAHGDSSLVCSYAIDPKSGRLTFINSQETGGDNSSTVTTDPGNRYVVIANGPGVAVFPRNEDGSLGPRCDLVIPEGEPGPLRDEQHGPHPHQATFDLTGRFLVVPDKGLDKIHVFRLDTAKGKLVPCDPPFVKSRYAAIPRHVAFHPGRPYAYVVNEADSTVTAYHWNTDRGSLVPFQRISTTPTTFVDDSTGAEIAIVPSGRFLYVSNRGHDSIAIYRVNPADGTLDHAGWESVQGKKPRFFGLSHDGSRLFAANEDSHTIVEFEVDPESGALTPTGQIIETGSPSCIVFSG
jgi:6-phosphogluconolactonase